MIIHRKNALRNYAKSIFLYDPVIEFYLITGKGTTCYWSLRSILLSDLCVPGDVYSELSLWLLLKSMDDSLRAPILLPLKLGSISPRFPGNSSPHYLVSPLAFQNFLFPMLFSKTTFLAYFFRFQHLEKINVSKF